MQKHMDAQIAGFLNSLPISEHEREKAAALIGSIAQSISAHLTPRAEAALLERGVTRDQAVEHLARRALQAVIEEGRK